jgi:hypothetical protein
MQSARRLLLAVALATFAAPTFADGFAPRAAVGIAHSDNVDRASVDQQTENVLATEAGFLYQRTRGALQVDMDAAMMHREYIEDVYESETLGRAQASAAFTLSPDRFAWIAQDYFGQIALLPFFAFRPEGREDANYFTTGPDVRFPIGGLNELAVMLRASDVYYEVSDTDHRQYDGQLVLERELDRRRRISLNAHAGRVKFDQDELYPTFDVEQGYVRFTTEGRRMNVALELGVDRVKDEVISKSGLLANFTVYRLISPTTTVGFDYARGFSNSARAFRVDLTSIATSWLDHNVPIAADPFDEDRLSLNILSARARLNTYAVVYGARQRYVRSVLFDRDVWGGTLRAGYELTPIMTGTLFGDYERADELGRGFELTDARIGAALQFRVTSSLQAELSVEHYDRDVSQGVFPEFSENRLLARLSYAPQVPLRQRTLYPLRKLPMPAIEGRAPQPAQP